MALPTQYNLLDTAIGDFVLNADAIAAIMNNSSDPIQMNLPGTSNGVGGLTRYFRWNVVDSLLEVRGQTKFIYRPTTDTFGTQIKTEFTGTAAEHSTLDVTADWKANGTTGGGLRAISGLARVDSTFSLGSTANMFGVRGIVQNSGTVSGTGLHAGVYALIEADQAWTSVGHLAARWADSHLVAAPGTGHLSFDYITNNGAAQFEQVWYIYGGNKITNLMALDTVTGMVSATTTGVPGGTIKKIKMLIDGVDYYLVASTIPG